MNRRDILSFVLLTTAMCTQISQISASQEEEDLDFLPKLSKAFMDIINSTNPLADDVTKRRVSRLLNKIGESLFRVRRGKKDILRSLPTSKCGDLGPTEQAVANMKISLETLSSQAESLALCIKPKSARDSALDAVDSIDNVIDRKASWLHQVVFYCSLSEREQDGLRSKIESSIDAITTTQRDLTALQDKVDSL